MHFYFEEAEKWAEYKESVFRQINRSGLPLVLFGKTSVVDNVFLQQIKVPVQFICDNNREKWGTKLWGLDVIDPARLQRLYTEYNVLILVPFEHQIIPQLQGLSTPPVEIFRLDLYFEEIDNVAYFRSVQEDVAEIYYHLGDQESKDTYEAVLHYRMNRNPSFLSEIRLPRQTQYFPAVLGGKTFLGTDETFVDAGAFIGDTIKTFCRIVQEKYRAIYAFEPDEENYKRLCKTCETIPKVTCNRAAVSDKTGEIRFVSDDSSSKADYAGGQSVSADTLDSLLKNVSISYLKMDVEGMECAALRGAKRMIQEFHPKLAVCTYHSNSDMIEVPKTILQLDASYKLYFRHYTNALVETVCYAV